MAGYKSILVHAEKGRTENYQLSEKLSIILAQSYNSQSILGAEILIPHFLEK